MTPIPLHKNFFPATRLVAPRGFTLIEIIIYMGVVSLILVALFEVTVLAQTSHRNYIVRSQQHHSAARVFHLVDFLVRNADGFVEDTSGNNCFSTSSLWLYFATSSLDFIPPGCMGNYASGAVGIEVGGTTGIETAATGIYYGMADEGDSIYLAGTDSAGWRLEKRKKSDLSLVTNFDYDGIVRVVTSDGNSTARDIAVDSTYVYAVGGNSNSEWRIEKRRLDNGALVPAFDGDGIALSSSSASIAYGIAIDSTYMYVVGSTGSGSWRIEKRLLSTGALCTAANCGTAFDTDGILITAGTQSDAYDIAIDGTYMYVVGNWAQTVCCFSIRNAFQIEKRLLTTGAYETGFDSDGSIAELHFESAIAYGITIDSNAMYIVGHLDADDWLIEKRLLTTGELVAAFSDDGLLTSDGTNIAYAVDRDSTFLYVVGDNDSSDWQIEKIRLSDGTYDTGFDSDGKLSGASASAIAYSAAVDTQFIYAGGSSTTGARIEKRFTASSIVDENRQGVRLICFQDYPNNGKAASCTTEPPHDATFKHELIDTSELYVGRLDLEFATTTTGSRQAIETKLNVGYRGTGLSFTVATVTASSTTSFRVSP